MVYGFLTALAGYLLGSLNFGIIVSRAAYKKDIRAYGSNNAGTTNMLRVFGAKGAASVFIGDFLKGAAAVLLARLAVRFLDAPSYAVAASTVCVVLGHVFPIYFKFKGGKGVATAFGAAIVFSAWAALALFLIFIAVAALTRYVSLGSVIAAGLYPFAVYLTERLKRPCDGIMLIDAFSAVLIGALIIVKHRGNIGRLFKGTEKKFSWNKNINGGGQSSAA